MCLRVNACVCTCLAAVWWAAVVVIFYVPITIRENTGPTLFAVKVAAFVVSVVIFFGLPSGVYVVDRYCGRDGTTAEICPAATIVRYNGPQPTAPPMPPGEGV
jgi:hypothetical protein